MTTSQPLIPGGGETGERVRTHDWAATPLGPITTWPATLLNTLRLMLNSAESMYLVWGTDKVFFYNDAYRAVLGPRLPFSLGAHFPTLWADAWEQVRPMFERALVGEANRVVHLPLAMARYGVPEHTWWTFSFSPVYDDGGQVNAVICVTNETTEHMLATHQVQALNAALEQRVRERTEERDRLWQMSSDIMLVANYAGKIVAVNPAWTDMLGWTEAQLLGFAIADFIHPDDQRTTRSAVAELSKGKRFLNFHNRYRHRDGHYLWLSWTAVPDQDYLHAVGRNIQAEKEATETLRHTEEALRQAQKLEAMGMLTGGVAHDFNNLLTVIKSSTDLLKRPSLAEDRRQRYVQAIADTVERASRLTGQLLSFARRQALRPQVFDVRQSVRSIADMMDSLVGARVQVEIELPDTPCYVDADTSQFDTALVNIAVNARDAMRGEGLLRIEVAHSVGIPGGTRSGDYVSVIISDSGSGIHPEQLGLIFEPFFTTKEIGHGTGLGLSQVFGFAKQSGGEVLVESQLGQGTRFALYLPRVAGDLATVEEPGKAQWVLEDDHGLGLTVLVVDDNEQVGTFATRTLEDLGYLADWVPNALAALEALASRPEHYRAVFSDVVMPGMSGLELGAEIRRLYPQLPVVLTTGYSEVLVDQGPQGFAVLNKPYSVQGLASVLGEAMATRPGA
jgi:PAS domain S-box-containing protein